MEPMARLFDARDLVPRTETPHRLDLAKMAHRVGYRRDVGDDEPLDHLRVLQRRHHRDLTAHAVAEQRIVLIASRAKARAHILGHLAVTHRLGPWRGAMVAQIECDDAVLRGKALCDRGPVAPRAEQPMQT